MLEISLDTLPKSLKGDWSSKVPSLNELKFPKKPISKNPLSIKSRADYPYLRDQADSVLATGSYNLFLSTFGGRAHLRGRRSVPFDFIYRPRDHFLSPRPTLGIVKEDKGRDPYTGRTKTIVRMRAQIFPRNGHWNPCDLRLYPSTHAGPYELVPPLPSIMPEDGIQRGSRVNADYAAFDGYAPARDLDFLDGPEGCLVTDIYNLRLWEIDRDGPTSNMFCAVEIEVYSRSDGAEQKQRVRNV